MKYNFIEKVLRECAVAYQHTTLKSEKSQLRAMMGACIRIVDDASPIGHASRAAKEVADNSGVNLSKMTWVNQYRVDRGRKNFAFEHKTPINGTVQRIIASPDDTLEILGECEIVWITREEDARLNALGYRKNRDDHNRAYSEAGIEIIALEKL